MFEREAAYATDWQDEARQQELPPEQPAWLPSVRLALQRASQASLQQEPPLSSALQRASQASQQEPPRSSAPQHLPHHRPTQQLQQQPWLFLPGPFAQPHALLPHAFRPAA